jgi:hypothetical protein
MLAIATRLPSLRTFCSTGLKSWSPITAMATS